MEGLIWVWWALIGCGGPEIGIRGFRGVWSVWYGYCRLWWIWRALDVLEMGWDGCEGAWVGERY